MNEIDPKELYEFTMKREFNLVNPEVKYVPLVLFNMLYSDILIHTTRTQGLVHGIFNLN